MDELEAKIRCLEVAERIAKLQNQGGDMQTVVRIQTELYSHITSAPSTDKPAKGPGKKTSP